MVVVVAAASAAFPVAPFVFAAVAVAAVIAEAVAALLIFLGHSVTKPAQEI